MSLADDLDGLLLTGTKPCQVCHLLGSTSPLEPGLRDKFRAALNAGIGAERLAKVMRKAGYLLPKQHVYDHRNDEHDA